MYRKILRGYYGYTNNVETHILVSVFLLHIFMLKRRGTMIVEVCLNNDYIVVRFSENEVSDVLQAAVDTNKSVEDLFHEIVSVGFNQVLKDN